MAILKIIHGASDYQVYQRSDNDFAQIHVKGVCEHKKDVVEACVLKGREPVIGWHPAGALKEGRWEALIENVPTGGPYTLRLRLKSHPGTAQAVYNVLVGDIWLLAGQSNMEGLGDLVNVTPPHPLIHAYTMAEYWTIAEEPLNSRLDSIDRAHNSLADPERVPWKTRVLRAYTEPDKRLMRPLVHRMISKWRNHRWPRGAGLGLPFAAEMLRRTGVPVGLLPCAHGATSISKWDPALGHLGGDSLYGSMMRRFKAAGGQVKGVLWYQGESDTFPGEAPYYHDRFKSFVQQLRDDLGNSELPFYFVQIGRYTKPLPPELELTWNAVQETQRKVCYEIPHSAMVASVDLELCDAIHVSTEGFKSLGKRLAKVACRELFQDNSFQLGPHFCRVEREDETTLRVSFHCVNGSLKSPDPIIGGFSLRNPAHHDLDLIESIEIEADKPTNILINLKSAAPEDAFLWYGFGADPSCRLTDSEEMAVPVFGPIEIEF